MEEATRGSFRGVIKDPGSFCLISSLDLACGICPHCYNMVAVPPGITSEFQEGRRGRRLKDKRGVLFPIVRKTKVFLGSLIQKGFCLHLISRNLSNGHSFLEGGLESQR